MPSNAEIINEQIRIEEERKSKQQYFKIGAELRFKLLSFLGSRQIEENLSIQTPQGILSFKLRDMYDELRTSTPINEEKKENETPKMDKKEDK